MKLFIVRLVWRFLPFPVAFDRCQFDVDVVFGDCGDCEIIIGPDGIRFTNIRFSKLEDTQ